MQLMEETHRLTVQQMVVAHNSELENLASRIRELQHELQTKSVSVFLALCLVCCSVSHAKKKIRKCGQCSFFAICIWMDACQITWNRRFLGDSWVLLCRHLQILMTFCSILWLSPPTHTRLTALFLGLPRWAGTKKVKPIWILLKQETVSGSGISWAICKSASRSRQITMPAPHQSSFLQAGCPSCHPTNSVKALKANNSYSVHRKWENT